MTARLKAFYQIFTLVNLSLVFCLQGKWETKKAARQGSFSWLLGPVA
jgi:hypothetical protein